MNNELKGLMAKFKITQAILSTVINTTTVTVNRKMKKGTFTQKELKTILKYLQKYDEKITSNIFFEN